jgi:hypothetical protein
MEEEALSGFAAVVDPLPFPATFAVFFAVVGCFLSVIAKVVAAILPAVFAASPAFFFGGFVTPSRLQYQGQCLTWIIDLFDLPADMIAVYFASCM